MMLRRLRACSACEIFDGSGWRLGDLELMARDSGSTDTILASHVVFHEAVRAPRRARLPMHGERLGVPAPAARSSPARRRVRVELGGVLVADSTRALRVLETTHPPAIYVPPEDVVAGASRRRPARRVLRVQGDARYFDVTARRSRRGGGLGLPGSGRRFAALRDHVSFYPGRMDACFLDDERVQAQEGSFYGGWITADIAGPVQGAAGTTGW